MTKRLCVLLLSVVVLAGAGVFAQAPAASTPADVALAALSTPTTVRMRGTIVKYDESTRVLTFSTENGTERLPLVSTARIRQGRDRIDTPRLGQLAGYRAAIRYSESAGNKTVESIHVYARERTTTQERTPR